MRVLFWSLVVLGWLAYAYTFIVFATPDQRRAVGAFVLGLAQLLGN